MQKPFLITGLPRSRTAWLAPVATIYGWSSCHHEPTLTMNGPMDLVNFYESHPEHYVGVSDSHLSQVLPTIMSLGISTLIVLRDPNEVHQSLEHLDMSTRLLPACLYGIAQVMGHQLVRTIDYKDLNNSYKLRAALRWLMPEADISLNRIRQMQSMHIEADLANNRKVWQNANQLRGSL